MIVGPMVTGIVENVLIWGLFGWVAGKAADLAAGTLTDGAPKEILLDFKKNIGINFRGYASSKGWFADSPRPLSTNHDLLRALRAAWIHTAQQKLSEIGQLHDHLMRAEAVPRIAGVNIAELLGTELRRLELNAVDRKAIFEIASPVELYLVKIVEAAPEHVQGKVERNFTREITESFVSGVIEICHLFGNANLDLLNRIEEILRENVTQKNTGETLEPGGAILNRFVENLKSGRYPQASKAYHMLVNGLIREDLASVRDELSILADMQGLNFDQLFEAVQISRQELNDFFEQISEFKAGILDEIKSISFDIKESISVVGLEARRVRELVSAPDHSLKATIDSSSLRQDEVSREFYGRDTEVEGLFRKFERSDKSLTLVTAPAGIGKSAFMAEVARRASIRGYSVASHFVTRKRQDTLEISQVLGHLLLQLRTVYRASENFAPVSVVTTEIRNEIDSYLAQDRPDHRPVLVIVDGLDTMPDELPVFTPAREVGKNVHVVLSCRVGQPDELPSALMTWGNIDTARSFELKSAGQARLPLQPLESSAILVWLSKRLSELPSIESTARFERIHALTTRVKEISEGLALFVSYLVDDIIARLSAGENIDVLLRRLKSMPPSFGRYLEAELSKNTADRSPPYGLAERKFLGLAAVAMGPLWDHEIGLLVDDIDPQNPPQAVTRWLSRVRRQGDDVAGWIIQHPRLAQPLKVALGVEALKAQESLVAHCKRVFDERSRYSARYAAVWGPKHLMQADDYMTAATWMSNSETLRWRLELAPERETIRAMSADFVELERQSLQQSGQLAAMASVFVTIAPTLYREVER